jgi:hypothetical protein
MGEDNTLKKVQLPFVMKPRWFAELIVLLALGFGILLGADFVDSWHKHPINFHNLHEIVNQGFCASFVLAWIFMWFSRLGKITCDDRGLVITIFGFTFKRIPWRSIRKIKFSKWIRSSDRWYLISHEGSFLGYKTGINIYMYRREDLAIFLTLLHQKTTDVKFYGFTGK